MMTYKKIRVYLFAVIAVLAVSAPSTYAATSKAVSTCNDSPFIESGSGPGKLSAHRSCENGYDAGVAGNDQADTCDQTNANDKKSCDWGFAKGADVRESSSRAKQAAQSGFDAGETKASSCKGLSGSQKDICYSAYKAAATAKAKKIGQEAADSGNKTDGKCASLGLKGSSSELKEYKKACEASFSKAKARADAQGKKSCGDIKTFFDYGCDSNVDSKKGGSDNPIVALILQIITWITAIVSVAIVGAITYGGVLYMGARDNSGQTQKAIVIIVDAVIGLFLLVGMFVIINFIVPGGLFN